MSIQPNYTNFKSIFNIASKPKTTHNWTQSSNLTIYTQLTMVTNIQIGTLLTLYNLNNISLNIPICIVRLIDYIVSIIDNIVSIIDYVVSMIDYIVGMMDYVGRLY